jgi:hypothetical protein
MKKSNFILLVAMMFRAGSLSAGEAGSACSGEGACGGTRGATVLSMMVWGVGLGAGIAVLCGLLDQDTAHAH